MKVHLSGIAGTGMSSLAGLFVQNNSIVAGSDTAFYPPVGDILKNLNITLYQGYRASNISADTDLCIIGNIISRGNPEAEHILNEKIPYMSMAEALYKYFIKGNSSLVVAGTHGKTTTSSFLAHLLHVGGRDPGFFIGGKPLDFHNNSRIGNGNEFVIEGDEYETSFFDRSSKFLKYFPNHLILTSIEFDHIDFFKTEANYINAFKNLVNQVPGNGTIVYNADYPICKEIITKSFSKCFSYGFSDKSDFRIENVAVDPDKTLFKLKWKGDLLEFETQMIGNHNLLNLSAGVIMGLQFELDRATLQQAVSSFKGVERRLVRINTKNQLIFIEDFAHHPTSISAVINTVKSVFPEYRVLILLEPASHSLRSNSFQDRLADALRGGDEVYIKDPFVERAKKADSLDLNQLLSTIVPSVDKVDVFKNRSDFELLLTNMQDSKKTVILMLSNSSFGGLPQWVAKLGKSD